MISRALKKTFKIKMNVKVFRVFQDKTAVFMQNMTIKMAHWTTRQSFIFSLKNI